ncbi:hypothetical protein SAMN06269185_1881 [Natronoarchaeum philippinense]|uniref:Uncharacterized protein n=1 Tax=Natronoarchaeum philippinense TaxID=558529 RepID=A0A285NUK4_NATPI|nr:hypothetical protein [Natronoarchaeum philippinense]SNZ12707.1 hypothetical protein SAMN06269185_1881 [Natronoarchaeum philippinense]
MTVGSSNRGGVTGAIGVDLRRLHESWMELVFPRQRGTGHSVLGKWTPNTTSGWIAYRLWSVLGVPIVAVLYPLALFGFMARFYSRRIDRVAAGLGVAGVVVLAAVLWGALTVLAHLRFTQTGFLAVLAAGVIATLSAGAATVFSRAGGRGTSILLAYPAAMTAIFLPPVAAALYSPALAELILPSSESVAIWVLDNLLTVGGLNEFLRSEFQLAGAAYLGMWFGIAVPLGWLLGVLVALADLVRPS